MPYIKDENNRRQDLRDGATALSAGELNFQIFTYIKEQRESYSPTVISQLVSDFLGDNPNYQKYNDMTGALIRCHREIKRRLQLDISYLLQIMASYDKEIEIYEDEKILENGDV